MNFNTIWFELCADSNAFKLKLVEVEQNVCSSQHGVGTCLKSQSAVSIQSRPLTNHTTRTSKINNNMAKGSIYNRLHHDYSEAIIF